MLISDSIKAGLTSVNSFMILFGVGSIYEELYDYKVAYNLATSNFVSDLEFICIIVYELSCEPRGGELVNEATC